MRYLSESSLQRYLIKKIKINLTDQDGNDQNEIMLLDANGCPTEGQIMGPLAKGKGEAKDLVANFDAFKFPSSEVGPDPTTLIQR